MAKKSLELDASEKEVVKKKRASKKAAKKSVEAVDSLENTDEKVEVSEVATNSVSKEYQFTVDWFSVHKTSFTQIINQLKPKRVLELGSFEGRSTCFLIDLLKNISPEGELHCIDSWSGGQEHSEINFADVEKRFLDNVQLAMSTAPDTFKVHVHKGKTDDKLVNLYSKGAKGYFDFIYVDASHEAPDVLFDALLSFKLLRKGGVIAFDDYNWQLSNDPADYDPIKHPRPAIDAFVNTHFKKCRVLSYHPLYQLYIQKYYD